MLEDREVVRGRQRNVFRIEGDVAGGRQNSQAGGIIWLGRASSSVGRGEVGGDSIGATLCLGPEVQQPNHRLEGIIHSERAGEFWFTRPSIDEEGSPLADCHF